MEMESEGALCRQKTLGEFQLGMSTSLPPVQSTELDISQFADVGKRGFSRKLHEMVKQQREMDKFLSVPKRNEKYELKNWRQYTSAQLSKMTAMQRSRYMMYEPVDKEVAEKQMQSLQRVRLRHIRERGANVPPSLKEMIEWEENSELIGQLKAAEAIQRIRNTQVTYESERSQELQHLISSQLTAQDAVRLQCFVPPSPVYVDVPDYLSKSQRKRCEEILEDDLGLTIKRTT